VSAAEVRVRTWTRSSRHDAVKGLLGYVSVQVSNFLLDGIVVRRAASGRLTLSFPARPDRTGRLHSYVRPLDDPARRAIESDILKQLIQRGDLAAPEDRA